MTYYEKVLERYLQPGETTLTDVFRRTARVLESDVHNLQQETLFRLFSESVFLPNSPTLANAGSTRGGCSACYVLPLEDSVAGIYKTAYEQAVVHAAFGGTGFDLSVIRPRGSRISSSGGEACGPCAVLEFLNQSAHLIRQGGKREGANMGILYDDHPDLDEFISFKDSRPYIKHFNISVGVHTRSVTGLDRNDLLYRIAEHSHATGDPGVIFVDRLNTSNRHVDEFGAIRATNPCIARGQRVLSSRGWIPIEELVIGDYVLSKGGKTLVINHMLTGHKECVRITLKNGMELICTPDHKLFTEHGWVEASKSMGYKVHVNTDGMDISDGVSVDHILSDLTGFWYGDGHISCNRIGFSFGLDEDIAKLYIQYMNECFGTSVHVHKAIQRSGNTCFRGISGKRNVVEYFSQFNKTIPPMTWDNESTKSFLRGLYSADGHIEVNNMCVTVSLTSSNKEFARNIQLLLQSLGIRSNIYVVKRTGHRTDEFYGINSTGYYYRINITGDSRKIFLQDIGFNNEKYYPETISYTTSSNSEVISIDPVGEFDVYDITVQDDSHSFTCEGFTVSNCGEQMLRPYECCNLGSINLSKFVEDGEFDIPYFERTVDTCVRILDRVIDVNNYPLEAIKAASLRTRKIGLGVMGWADALVLLGISYRSTEAIDLIHQIGASMQNVANNVSTELGELLGPYTSGDRRNENLITIAPTGTLSYFAGCSGGIEPNFGWDIIRETEAGETVIKHPLYEKYVKGSDLEKDIAHSISAYWQIEHQATWQLYVDNAVSKTINLPSTADIEDFYSAYRQAYERDCKGVTIYRDGSKTTQTLRHGESVPIDHCRERPAKVYERKSGCGTIYVIPSEMPGNMAPWDTFAITSGGCAANSEAIGRLISGWLQDPIPSDGVPARIGHILHSVDCPKCSRRDGCDGNSCADIIGRVLVEHYMKAKTDDRPVCPNCKHHLNFGSGCNQGECPVCGWSGCN